MTALQFKTSHSAVMLIHSSLAFLFILHPTFNKLEQFRDKYQLNDTNLLYRIYLTFLFNLFIGYVKYHMQYLIYEGVAS